MKTIGLLGGMSWESSKEYYRLINEEMRNRLGNLHSAEILMASVDFAPLSEAMEASDWNYVEAVLVDRTAKLTAAGAQLMLICTNTMHKLADAVRNAAGTAEFIHIGECAAAHAISRGYSTVALLGTRFTLEEDFYRGRLEDAGLTVFVPGKNERRWIDTLIFGELCRGVFPDQARTEMADIVASLAARGAEAVVLGCTELPLIINSEESSLPLIDTMAVHAHAAVDAALAP